MIGLLLALLFVLIFSALQGGVFVYYGTTPVQEAKKKMESIRTSSAVRKFMLQKQIQLKKMGAGILLKDQMTDQMTVSQWYLYKGIMAGLFAMTCFFVTDGMMKMDAAKYVSVILGIGGWFFLDVILRAHNKSSNEEMMPDIMEMSRSVLYGKRGGQYIADALKDAVMVVENKRLKAALMRLRNDLDTGRSLEECLNELELSFSNGEISSFCTVIKSLQSTGQVDEALRTLENNIEREQVSVNKKRCIMLEHKTMIYVIFIAMDILAMILYCIVLKLLQLQIGF